MSLTVVEIQSKTNCVLERMKMTYRIDNIDVPPGDPFANDLLEREEVVTFLSNLIESLQGPFVLALDSPFGTGKTTLVHMLKETLKDHQNHSIYFNAWKVDYVIDPLVALVSSINRIDLENPDDKKRFQHSLEFARKLTTHVATRGIVAGVKGLTAGAVDLDEEVREFISALSENETTGDIVKKFNQEQDFLEQFRTELEKAVKTLPHVGNGRNLVIFIDELDRCRPTFAIQLLERIKHLFDIPNIIFVLSIDKQQLEFSIAEAYGTGTNASEYLRRFIDLDYRIPDPSSKSYTSALVTRFGLDEFLSMRGHKKGDFVEHFTYLANLMELTLRAKEKCMARLRVAMNSIPNYKSPFLMALLIVLRSNKPALFTGMVEGSVSSEQVMKMLLSTDEIHLPLLSHQEQVLYAYLLVVDPDQQWAKKRLKHIQHENPNGKLIIDICESVKGSLWPNPRAFLEHIAGKIDFISNIRD